MRDVAELIEPIRAMHEAIRAAVVTQCEQQTVEQLAAVVTEEGDAGGGGGGGDTIYAVDRVSEHVLVDHLEAIAERVPLILLAEGLPSDGVVLPRGTSPADAIYRVLVDPIDGTRGLMYQKRPAWVLTGVAPNRGPATRLRDIELAIQTEIPLVKQHLCDQLWVCGDGPPTARRLNRLTGEHTPLTPRPSQATTIDHGCVSFARFFPGARDVLAAVDEQVMHSLLGQQPPGKALCFEDQYACTGGQLYELMMGRDRVIADLRPLVADVLRQRGRAAGLCCHPYDLCTLRIAEAAGVVVTDAAGAPLDAPLNLEADVTWVGYANASLRTAFEPALRAALRDHGLNDG
ncbi:MAG: hypothetical protein WD009_01675 [Phycisphaeraceae bacterium]